MMMVMVMMEMTVTIMIMKMMVVMMMMVMVMMVMVMMAMMMVIVMIMKMMAMIMVMVMDDLFCLPGMFFYNITSWFLHLLLSCLYTDQCLLKEAFPEHSVQTGATPPFFGKCHPAFPFFVACLSSSYYITHQFVYLSAVSPPDYNPL